MANFLVVYPHLVEDSFLTRTTLFLVKFTKRREPGKDKNERQDAPAELLLENCKMERISPIVCLA